MEIVGLMLIGATGGLLVSIFTVTACIVYVDRKKQKYIDNLKKDDI